MRHLGRTLLPALILAALALAPASTPAAARTIHFHGRSVEAPRSWPVIRLARHPGLCARLDRRAVYLGAPGAEQRCPAAAAVGPRRAILLDPSAAARARASRAFAGTSRAPARSAPRSAATASAAGSVSNGFDACTAPSLATMSDWLRSPFRTVGVYIGGANRACSQPNLTSSWVGAVSADGWRLIPTYVGLQAPTSSCGSCAKLSASRAAAQGTAAAEDAVVDAEAVAIGPGNPIYFDMEAYTRTSSATSATLAFLSAWTASLHTLGYLSGVYSSSASGIADVAAQWGTGYRTPDDLWIANWNGRADTDDPYVSASAWVHRRIHQYRGAHDETWGGSTINIDSDYVDGDTAAETAVPSEEEVPKGRLDAVESPLAGQVRVVGWAFDPAAPTVPLSIRAYVGGRAGSSGAARYDLGPAAVQLRSDVAAAHRAAGGEHGFDLSFAVAKSRHQRVCVYALGIVGSEKLLGCRGVGIAVPLRLSHLRSVHRGLRLGVGCEWPVGAECPGQLVLRGRVHLPATRHRRARTVWRVVGRRHFHMRGGGSHAFLVRLNRLGRTQLQARGALRARLLAAIPGGRLGRGLTLRRPR
jgi:hypothetical protein